MQYTLSHDNTLARPVWVQLGLFLEVSNIVAGSDIGLLGGEDQCRVGTELSG